MAPSPEDHLSKMALPTLVGKHVGKQLFGQEYIVYPWIAYIEQRILEAVNDEDHERYIVINAPPQTGKSSYVGVLLPFWLTGMFPNKNLMYISYSDDFSKDKSKEVRKCHRLWGEELFGSKVDPDFDTAAEWRVDGGRGGFLAAGVGGLITGKPGDIIIIDDLIKNAEEARSKAAKTGHVEEWDGTISRRVQPGTTVIIIATRWAEDDLTGVLKERMAQPGYDGPQWEFMEFPAFAEPGPDVELTEAEEAEWRDIIGREFGEVLDCRFTRLRNRAPDDFFRKAKAGMDATFWSALYQQHPSIREGGLFPRENWVYEDPETWCLMEEVVRVWDLAATEGGGDYTVGTKVGRGVDGRYYIMDVMRFRHDPGTVQEIIERQAHIDGYGCKIQIEEEKGGSGKSLTEFYRRLLPGFNVSPAKAEGDKMSRCGPHSIMQNRQQEVLPTRDSASWSVKDFVDEHSKLMPDGRGPKNDDQIDTAAYAILDLVGRMGVSLWIPGVETPSPGDLVDGDGELELTASDAFVAAERVLTRRPITVGGQPVFG